MPHLHLYNRAGFQDNAAKSGKPGHRAKFRDCPGQTGTLGNYDLELSQMELLLVLCCIMQLKSNNREIFSSTRTKKITQVEKKQT